MLVESSDSLEAESLVDSGTPARFLAQLVVPAILRPSKHKRRAPARETRL
jgi:hypothetical protein